MKPKVSRRLEIMNIRSEINETKENRKAGGENYMNKNTRSWFFDKTNTINEHVA